MKKPLLTKYIEQDEKTGQKCGIMKKEFHDKSKFWLHSNTSNCPKTSWYKKKSKVYNERMVQENIEIDEVLNLNSRKYITFLRSHLLPNIREDEIF